MRRFYSEIRLIAAVFIFLAGNSFAAESRMLKNVIYARRGDVDLSLDLYFPPEKQHGPLIVWVHGGAWRSGSKREMPLGELVAQGFSVASVDYTLSTVAPFPAQIHDIKAAIRFLRAEGRKLGVNSEQVVVAGASAGGHLAALTGVTGGDHDLEGEIGSHGDQSSSVQGIISFFGAANLTTILAQSTPHGLSVRVPALELLLGGPPDARSSLARLASPVFHVDKNDPPLLLLHGDQDAQMPVNQALELQGAYESAGAKCRLVIVHGAGHGGKMFFDQQRIALVEAFLADNFPR